MTYSTRISIAVSAAFMTSFIAVAYVRYTSTTRMLETQIRVRLEDNTYNNKRVPPEGAPDYLVRVLYL